MRAILSYVLISLLTCALFVDDALAKRFGGSRSISVQRSKNSSFNTHPNYNTVKKPPQVSSSRRWGGVLAGLLIGGLLTSMFMGHGFVSGLLSWLVIGGLVLAVIQFIQRRRRIHSSG